MYVLACVLTSSNKDIYVCMYVHDDGNFAHRSGYRVKRRLLANPVGQLGAYGSRRPEYCGFTNIHTHTHTHTLGGLRSVGQSAVGVLLIIAGRAASVV